MKLALSFILLSFSTFSHLGGYPKIPTEELRNSESIFVTVGSDFTKHSRESIFMGAIEVLHVNEEKTLLKVKEAALPLLSEFMHEEFKRCGGFFRHENLNKAIESIESSSQPRAIASLVNDYSLNQAPLVNSMMTQVIEDNISNTIIKLSSYRNRYYKSKYGVESSEWIYDHWKDLAGSRTDINVMKWKHKWPQPSIIMEIKGKSDEIIVIGGHADSTSGFFGGNYIKAPGADDNASGIATITEVIRVILENNYVPEKTLMFMGYAAEEAGLLGSHEIAGKFKEEGKNVIGVLQLDMTNLNGSEEDIVLITDYTNEEQNKFLANLIDTYLPRLKWGTDKCGYACSDHAAWTAKGFPASTPFEAKKRDMNSKIHTKNDTFKTLKNNSLHAVKFTKLALAYLIELDQ